MGKTAKLIISFVVVIFSVTVIWLNIRSSKRTLPPSDLTRSKTVYPKVDKPILSERKEIFSESKVLPKDDAETALKKATPTEYKPLTKEEANLLIEEKVVNENEAKEIMKLEKRLKEAIQ